MRGLAGIVDVLLGGAKELFVGDEFDGEEQAERGTTWHPTTLHVLLLTDTMERALELKALCSRLSDDWRGHLRSLELPVQVLRDGWY